MASSVLCHHLHFECGCELLPSGEISLCDVCLTTLDLHAQLITEESSRILGYDELLGKTYTCAAAAIADGVSEKEIDESNRRTMDLGDEITQRQLAQFYMLIEDPFGVDSQWNE
jgi:hypothetical protein